MENFLDLQAMSFQWPPNCAQVLGSALGLATVGLRSQGEEEMMALCLHRYAFSILTNEGWPSYGKNF